MRERELRAAADLLDVGRVVVLDYEDSGIAGEVDDRALVAAPLDRVAATIAAIIDDVRPDLVLTLDGSDGHRDHIHIRDATLLAVEQAEWTVDRIYLVCLARSLMQEWVAHVGRGRPRQRVPRPGRLGTPDEDITTVIDTSGALRLAVEGDRRPTPPDVAHSRSCHLTCSGPSWRPTGCVASARHGRAVPKTGTHPQAAAQAWGEDSR